jgi:hypothetical protein
VAVLLPFKTASRKELWKSSLGSIVGFGCSRVGSSLRHRPVGPVLLQAAREVPRTTVLATAEPPSDE